MQLFRERPGFEETEEREVRRFLNRSINYKALLQLHRQNESENLNDIKRVVESLQSAQSFHSIEIALSRFDPDDHEGAANFVEFVILPKVIYSGIYIVSYFNDAAKVAVYATRLVCEAKLRAKEFNQYQRETQALISRATY